MTQAKGLNSKLMLGFETTYNNDPSDVSTKCVAMPFNTVSLKASQALNASATITGRRDPVEPYRGNIDVAGDIVVPLDLTLFGEWLKACFGAPTTTDDGGIYTHVYKPTSSQPSLVVEVGHPDIFVYAKYNGVKVSKIAFSVGGDGEVNCTISTMGGKETIAATSVVTTPVTMIENKVDNKMAAIKIDGAECAIATLFTLNIDFGLDGDQYSIGNAGFRGAVNEGIMAITGTLTAFFNDKTYLEKAAAGTPVAFELDITKGTSSLKFELPEAVFARNTPGVDGPKGIKQELNYTAYYKEAALGNAIAVTLENDTATY